MRWCISYVYCTFPTCVQHIVSYVSHSHTSLVSPANKDTRGMFHLWCGSVHSPNVYTLNFTSGPVIHLVMVSRVTCFMLEVNSCYCQENDFIYYYSTYPSQIACLFSCLLKAKHKIMSVSSWERFIRTFCIKLGIRNIKLRLLIMTNKQKSK